MVDLRDSFSTIVSIIIEKVCDLHNLSMFLFKSIENKNRSLSVRIPSNPFLPRFLAIIDILKEDPTCLVYNNSKGLQDMWFVFGKDWQNIIGF